MAATCSKCNTELEDKQPPEPCPKCGSTERNVGLVAKAGVVTVSVGMAKMRVVRHWERLLETADELYNAGCKAEELYKPGYLGAAVMVAQTACEVVIELAVTTALRKRTVADDLISWIDGNFLSYSPKNEKVRGIYGLLTGDVNLSKQPFWQSYCDMVKHRNSAGHDGQPVSQADSRSGIDVAKQLVGHIVRHNGLA